MDLKVYRLTYEATIESKNMDTIKKVQRNFKEIWSDSINEEFNDNLSNYDYYIWVEDEYYNEIKDADYIFEDIFTTTIDCELMVIVPKNINFTYPDYIQFSKFANEVEIKIKFCKDDSDIGIDLTQEFWNDFMEGIVCSDSLENYKPYLEENYDSYK